MNTGLYSHYKGGTYQVLGIGQHSESGEMLVIYVSLDPTKHGPRLRARPLSMWDEKVTWPDGSTKSRFVHIGDMIPAAPAADERTHRCSHCGANLKQSTMDQMGDFYHCPHSPCPRFRLRIHIPRGGGAA